VIEEQRVEHVEKNNKVLTLIKKLEKNDAVYLQKNAFQLRFFRGLFKKMFLRKH
jgi:hypothetical protein